MWGELPEYARRSLEGLSRTHILSVAAGDLQFLNGRWYVTHTGLLGIAQRRLCSGIRTAAQKDLCDPVANRWVFRATVFKSPVSKGIYPVLSKLRRKSQRLLQLRVLRFGFLQDGNIRVGVLPQHEEILIRGAGFAGVTLQGECM